uniref:Uncharacterized protein n=1 Tax=Chrysotila carterae TaxID=13221 RepID=A0A7S4FB13_CHRCT|mmetsp:Transcript_5523/g.10790  ORF Transcript_5523/g.10790 Transcript_5523/m.10790 type:complete len:473 (-) Transcript_5523:281-1699(-)
MDDGCRFRFGTEYRGDDRSYEGVDYLTVWIGQSSSVGNDECVSPPCFNPYWHGSMLNLVRKLRISAAYYAYIIAFLAKHIDGLHDCDMGTPSLCQGGANFIRSNLNRILATYDKFANETAVRLGRSASVLWLIEPDWHQYHEDTQEGGGLQVADMVRLFNEITARILRHLPEAKISFDISPWVNNQEQWLRPFIQSCTIHYMHTSGGRTSADSPRIRAHDGGNMVTWRQVYDIARRGIIADTGYGVGGLSLGLDESWNRFDNLKARISDGVIAITQANPGAGWAGSLGSLRSELAWQAPLRECSWAQSVYAPAPPPHGAAAHELHEQAGDIRNMSYYALLAALGIGVLISLVCFVRRKILAARSRWARLHPRSAISPVNSGTDISKQDELRPKPLRHGRAQRAASGGRGTRAGVEMGAAPHAKAKTPKAAKSGKPKPSKRCSSATADAKPKVPRPRPAKACSLAVANDADES